MTPQERKALKLALEALKENQHLVADNERHAYVMEYNSIIEKCEEALAQPKEPEQNPVAWYHPEDDRTYFTAYPSQDMIENGYWQPLYEKGAL